MNVACFGPFLLWPNGWMHQDATWYGGRRRPRRLCVWWGPSPQKHGHSPIQFWPCLLWPKGWMDQDATWYGSRPRPRPHYVRRGPSSPAKGAQQPAPSFRPMSIVATVAHLSYCWALVGYVRRSCLWPAFDTIDRNAVLCIVRKERSIL